jgi:hypothetical protein
LFVFKMPLAGGAPTRVSAAAARGFDLLLSNLFAADASAVFVTTMTGGKGQLVRVSIADGVHTVIAEHDGALNSPQLFGGHAWFGPKQNTNGIYKAPTSATAAAGVKVGVAEPSTLNWVVTAQGIFTAGALGISHWDLEGLNKTTAFEPPRDDSGLIVPQGADDTSVYLVPATGSRGRAIRKIAPSGFAASVVACDRRGVTNFRVGATDLFWVENETIFRVPR